MGWCWWGNGEQCNCRIISRQFRGLQKAVVPPCFSADMYTPATTLISLNDILPPWHHALKRKRSSQLGGLRHWEGVGDVPQSLLTHHCLSKAWSVPTSAAGSGCFVSPTHVLLRVFLHPSRLSRCWRGLGTSAWSLSPAQGRRKQGSALCGRACCPPPQQTLPKATGVTWRSLHRRCTQIPQVRRAHPSNLPSWRRINRIYSRKNRGERILLIFKNISVFLELRVLSDLSKSLAEEWVGSKTRIFTSFPAASVKINIILLTEEAVMPMHCIEP